MITLLNVHSSRVADLEAPDHVTSSRDAPQSSYRDIFGNSCTRLVAPEGQFSISTETVILDSGLPDPIVPEAEEHPVADLPDEALQFLLPSRYCDTDMMSNMAWDLFQNVPPGWSRVQAICDHVHNHIHFDYQQARATRTASDAFNERVGVCRDFTPLAVTFCRAMNIPARYCNGYLGDIGTPPPFPPGDFAAWMEVYIGGAWRTFDPRNNVPRIGRVLVSRGRDAADVPLIHSFGNSLLTGFQVWTDELVAEAA
jgi:transglutaminase-like putative cysteine protease